VDKVKFIKAYAKAREVEKHPFGLESNRKLAD
jgi:hypothetical protein